MGYFDKVKVYKFNIDKLSLETYDNKNTVDECYKEAKFEEQNLNVYNDGSQENVQFNPNRYSFVEQSNEYIDRIDKRFIIFRDKNVISLRKIENIEQE